MDHTIKPLLEALKNLIRTLSIKKKPLSFNLVMGEEGQGKSAVLSQSKLTEILIYDEYETKIYYNDKGIILEVSDSWLKSQNLTYKQLFKQINQIHRAVQITGIIYCIDIQTLLGNPTHHNKINHHYKLIQHFITDWGYSPNFFIIFTKLDVLAGFAEFYSIENQNYSAKTLGFSLEPTNSPAKSNQMYLNRFNQLIEVMGQTIIPKLHPIRSSTKRTLIREFPLQLVYLKKPIYQLLNSLPALQNQIRGIYFTSAEQGGKNIDPLNKKMQHEYALTIPYSFIQANNHCPFFIDGAIKNIQAHTKPIQIKAKFNFKIIGIQVVILSAIIFIILGINHKKTSHLLDKASIELLAYETSIYNKNTKTEALYHLIQANNKIANATANPLTRPALSNINTQFNKKTKKILISYFLPTLIESLEKVIQEPKFKPGVHYEALKIYLMLNDARYYSKDAIKSWFHQYWQSSSDPEIKKKLALLEYIDKEQFQQVIINPNIIDEARRVLNSLPTGYLYYNIIKQYFSKNTTHLVINGFNLAHKELPLYYTKTGFQQITKAFPKLTKQLQNESWVLKRNDLTEIPYLLPQAYCYDYANWWKSFLKYTNPININNFQHGGVLLQELKHPDGITKLLKLIQQNTRPDLNQNNLCFNTIIATEFTDLNLITQNSMHKLLQTLSEMRKLLTTLALINDNGQTTFNITQRRFNNIFQDDPLSLLYEQQKKLPNPLSRWTQQLANESWSLLIQESQQFINKKWNENIFSYFQSNLAHHYPIDNNQINEISINEFNHFFAKQGLLNQFINQYIKPFLDTSKAKWEPKIVNGYIFPFSDKTLQDLMHANVITNMFFPGESNYAKIDFSLQKVNMDPIIANLELKFGQQILEDDQNSQSFAEFTWPENYVKLSLDTINGQHHEIEEKGLWALFRLLNQAKISINKNNPTNMQVFFNLNGNSGHYLLITSNFINPFTPGILQNFNLTENIV